jgi:hypothetical protein
VQKYFSPVGSRFLEFAKSFGAQHLRPLAAEAKGPLARHGAAHGSKRGERSARG